MATIHANSNAYEMHHLIYSFCTNFIALFQLRHLLVSCWFKCGTYLLLEVHFNDVHGPLTSAHRVDRQHLHCFIQRFLLPPLQKFIKVAKLGNRFHRIRQFMDRLNRLRPSYILRYFVPSACTHLQSQVALYLWRLALFPLNHCLTTLSLPNQCFDH